MSNPNTLYRAQQAERRSAFAAELFNVMTEKGFNQTELARKAGIPRDQVSRYFNADVLPGRKNQDRLAKALGVNRTDLLKTWNKERHKGEYLSIRSASQDRVAIEIKRTVSQEQASQIMQILGTESAVA